MSQAVSDRVLVAHSEGVTRKWVAHLFEQEGFKTSEALTLDELVAAIDGEMVDLVLAEAERLALPLFERYPTRSLRDEALPVPLIALVRPGGAVSRAQALDAGAADAVELPVAAAELLARARVHLRVCQLRRSSEEVNTQLLRLADQLLDRERRLEEDLAAAAEIQRALLPASPPAPEGYAIAHRVVPSIAVGGDLVGVQELGGGLSALFVVDVAGHGVSAAMVTVAVANALSPQSGLTRLNRRRGETGGLRTPREVLEELDARFPFSRFERPFTVGYALLEAASGRVRYAAAAHPPALVVRQDGACSWIEEGGPPIGLGRYAPFEEGETTLGPGERLVLYTDGIVEARSPTGEHFGAERLAAALREAQALAPEELIEELIRRVHQHAKGRVEDDLSLLVVAREP